MKKHILRAVACALLFCLTLACLSSCASKITKYEERLDTLRKEDKLTYFKADDESILLSQVSLEQRYGVQAEITMLYSVFHGTHEYASVVEFGSTSQAKDFEKQYKKENDIDLEGTLRRVYDRITGDFEGDLNQLFSAPIACERDGKVVVWGNTSLVKSIVS